VVLHFTIAPLHHPTRPSPPRPAAAFALAHRRTLSTCTRTVQTLHCAASRVGGACTSRVAVAVPCGCHSL
jgi:hypothetical protein